MQKLSPVILVFCLSLLLVSCANEEITKSDELKPFSLVSPPSNDVNEEERDKILSVVLLTDLAFEACGHDHPSLKPQLQEAFAAWKKKGSEKKEKMELPPFLPATKNTYRKHHPKEQPANLNFY